MERRVEIFRTRRQLFLRVPTFKVRYYVRFVGDNDEKLVWSEAYTQKHNATEMLARYFPDWPVKDLT